MKFKFLLPAMLCLSLSLLTNCKPSEKKEVKLPAVQDSTQNTKDTTSLQNQDSTGKEEKIDPALKSYMENAHKEFDGVPSTFEAKYLGFDIGDYPHIIFKDKNNKEYDFGDGNNSYGSFKEEDIETEKSKYEDKMFKVTWEWKTSSFSCCDGEMSLKTAKVPSIVNLELVKVK
jgi:hypothetical protein